MSALLQDLRERGLVAQTTDDAGLDRLLDSGPVTLYCGFDPSASSFHIGNLLPIFTLVRFQRAGHKPIAIIGGGTGRVGDPSGKQEMRKMLVQDEIAANLDRFRSQLGRFLDFAPGQAALLDNAEWLSGLNYIEFLRDIGRHFSVNRMLTADCFKTRLESEAGLSFLEFNYMLLQAYDFLELYRRRGCKLQVGGSDQWGNIVAGIDLIRRVEGGESFGLTIPLVTTAAGAKMGKTAAGAVWIDAARTSPYEFYQYWINTDDRDVGRFLRIFTFLPLEEVRGLEALQGADIRRAKEVLAFEVTAHVHGADEARKAQEAARSLFGGGGEGADVPSGAIARVDLEKNPLAVNIFADYKLCPSRGEARRLARQGGLYVNGEAIAEDRTLSPSDAPDGHLQLRMGKKRHLKLVVLE